MQPGRWVSAWYRLTYGEQLVDNYFHTCAKMLGYRLASKKIGIILMSPCLSCVEANEQKNLFVGPLGLLGPWNCKPRNCIAGLEGPRNT